MTNDHNPESNQLDRTYPGFDLSKVLRLIPANTHPDDVREAVQNLVKVVSDAPVTGATLEPVGGVAPFMIPLHSEGQKKMALKSLKVLGIFPYEENATLIIERVDDLKIIRALGLLPAEEVVERRPRDSAGSVKDEYRFPLPHPPKVETGTNERENEVDFDLFPNTNTGEEGDPGLDHDLKKIVARWDQGILDPDDDEFVDTFGRIPDLKLFPQRYVWRKGVCYKKDTGEEISPKEYDELLVRAQHDLRNAGDNNSENVRTLVEMHTGMVLYVLAKVRKRFSVEADDLFQEGMIGLIKAIEDKDMDNPASFSAYAFIIIEAHMRRSVANYDRQVRIPTNVRGLRRAYFQALEEIKKELPGFSPADAGFKTLMIEKLNNKGILGIGNGLDTRDFDRWLRTFQLEGGYVEEVAEPEYVDSSMVTMTGDDVHPLDEPEQERFKELLKEKLSESLQSLTPNRELVLRMRFGLVNDKRAPKIFGGAAQSFLANPNVKGDLKEIVQRVIDAKLSDFNPTEFQSKSPKEKFLLSLAGKVPGDFANGHELSLEEAANFFGVSSERVRQIETSALRKLKHPSLARRLIGFWQ